MNSLVSLSRPLLSLDTTQTPKSRGWEIVADVWVQQQIQTSVYVARGFLIESKNPTWLYGTSSEHAVFYQYQFFQASNLVAGIIQSEQPYYQPTPKPPEPFKDAVGAFNGDPTFPCTDTEPCDEGWALRVVESSDLHIIGAGLYSWFDTYTQDCGTFSASASLRMMWIC